MLENQDTSQSEVISRGVEKGSAWLESRHDFWKLGLPRELQESHSHIPIFLAIGGGKGGVGKSIFSANLAARLAHLGFKVLLADMDIGCSNLHTHFGIHRPSVTFADLLKGGQEADFNDIILQTPVANLGLITGGRDDYWIKTYEAEANDFLVPFWKGLLNQRESRGIDFVIFDLGAGLHSLTVDLFSSAHFGMAVTLPEPTSIENVYVFLKSVLFRLAEKAGDGAAAPMELAELLAMFRQVGKEAQGTYVEILKRFSQASPVLVSQLAKLLRSRILGVLVNQARSQYEMDLGLSMQQICSRYFGFHTCPLGHLSFDDAAWKSLRNRRLLLSDFPHSPFASQIGLVGQEILKQLKYRGR